MKIYNYSPSLFSVLIAMSSAAPMVQAQENAPEELVVLEQEKGGQVRESHLYEITDCNGTPCNIKEITKQISRNLKDSFSANLFTGESHGLQLQAIPLSVKGVNLVVEGGFQGTMYKREYINPAYSRVRLATTGAVRLAFLKKNQLEVGVRYDGVRQAVMSEEGLNRFQGVGLDIQYNYLNIGLNDHDVKLYLRASWLRENYYLPSMLNFGVVYKLFKNVKAQQ